MTSAASSLLTRRALLTSALKAAPLAVLAPHWAPLLGDPAKRGFKIGACDWSIGKMADAGSFEVARQIGLDGVQVSLGTAADDMKLRQAEVQQAFLHAAQKQNQAIASLAIGELNSIPYKSDPRTEAWVADAVDVMKALGVKVVLLAFFGKGDLKGDQAGTDEVVRRLRRVAPKAEKAGVVLGLESWLSAEEHMDIIQRVGSPAVKVYYDVANSEKMGYDIYKEIRWLGKQHICELHFKENDALLGQGRVDFKKVRAALDDIGYSGWAQIEGAVPKGSTMIESYPANAKFLRPLFPAQV
jgi:sugar phosphate isomerase/epimerase